ncbi:MAG TPA: LytTR family DNA-binding domain-containing protein [Rhodothermales bacterium]|nr:LytTR family DNA-binding domain-containing protein [Rhodothermales bacterium]
MTLRVVIADDEPLVRERLRTLLEGRPDCTLVAECADGAEALATIEAERPDLALLDVQMPELDGFVVVEALPDDVRPAVVFITAFDEYAVRAFETGVVDYLLKPIEPARFELALRRATERRMGPASEPDWTVLMPALRAHRGYPERIVVRDGHRVTFVPVADLDWIEGAGNYVQLHVGGRTLLLRDTMKALEARLNPDRFVRVHRSAIVNLERIVAMEPYFHGEYVLTLRDGTRLTSSRTHSPRLRVLLR